MSSSYIKSWSAQRKEAKDKSSLGTNHGGGGVSNLYNVDVEMRDR